MSDRSGKPRMIHDLIEEMLPELHPAHVVRRYDPDLIVI
jgi:hypothetical protein